MMSRHFAIACVVIVALFATLTAARLSSPLHEIKFRAPNTPYNNQVIHHQQQHPFRFTQYTNITASELYTRWSQAIQQYQDIYIVDVREDNEYEGAHIPGAYSYPLSTLDTTWTQLPTTEVEAVYIHCAGGVRSLKAIAALEANGYKGKMINIQDGFNAWTGPKAQSFYDNMPAATLLDVYTRKGKGGIQIVDVREVEEYVNGHIPGAKNMPLSVLEDQYKTLPTNYPTLYIHCAGGVRSLKAINQLHTLGYRGRFINIEDGFNAWTGPVEKGQKTISGLQSYVEALYAMNLVQRPVEKVVQNNNVNDLLSKMTSP